MALEMELDAEAIAILDGEIALGDHDIDWFVPLGSNVSTPGWGPFIPAPSHIVRTIRHGGKGSWRCELKLQDRI